MDDATIFLSFYLSLFIQTIPSAWTLDVALLISIFPVLGYFWSHIYKMLLPIYSRRLNQPVSIIFKLLM